MKVEQAGEVLAEAPAYLSELAKRMGNGGFDEVERLEAEDRLREIFDAIDTDVQAEAGEPRVDLKRSRISEHADELKAALAGGVEIVKLNQRPRHNLTDLGNAERFADDHAGELRVIPLRPRARWYAWDGRRWRHDDSAEVMRRSRATVRSIRDEARLIEDNDLAEKVFKWATGSEQRARLESIPRLAEADERLVVAADDLDADRWLLNTTSGTLDLRSGKVHDHDPADLLTKLAPVAFEPGAGCPTWERCLAKWTGGDTELVAFLQRAAGYSLTGDTSEQVLFLLTGDGANGKTTFLEALAAVLGDYARTAAASTFMTRPGRSVRSDLARLHGARFVSAAEVEEDARFAETLVKQMTGGDKVVASFLYQDEFEFRPAFKVWIAANALPEIRGTDHAIWRRIRRIPFAHRVERPDRRLPEKLRAERAGILRWAVEGCRRWVADGLGEAPEVSAATEVYRAAQDTVAAFVREWCQFGTDETVRAQALQRAYVAWCERAGVEPLTHNRFPAAVRSAVEEAEVLHGGVEQRRSSTGLIWHGMGLCADVHAGGVAP